MSKKHKHNHNDYDDKVYEMESLTSEQKLAAVIIILKALIEKIKENSMKIKEVPMDGIDLKKEYNTSDTYENNEESHDVEVIEQIDETNSINNSNKLYDIENAVEEDNKNDLEDMAYEIIPSSKVISCESTTIELAKSQTLNSNLSFKSAVAKVPIILSEFEIQIFIEALIKFPEPVFQVKSLEKNVFLSKCDLIPSTDKLFIEGFLKEDIEYATASNIRTHTISGDVKKATFNIPLQCSTRVSFAVPPILRENLSMIELEVINSGKSSANIVEKDYGYFEFFNEKIYCKLNEIKIMETNIKESVSILQDTLEGAEIFKDMRKKAILSLKLSLIQNQEVFNE
ncbi:MULTISPECIES: CsxC family protein [Clostridium]|uniref:DUF7852 domain-containing protein n=2 Tax=Clostridium TaxID=1485 RepID=A0A151ARJ1_9CLOT|nr:MULTISPECIES: hypothetical protein [Clostridium]KYH30246.1 hypothetical protein CLCOL_01900 [Clostridium colicanis DSM 13634]MBE6044526.1 hypothetical protein [Clostridium thermopalmarium]PRR69360.1 hypothetical protein CPAL_24440 [Clostridium thermopalmarium DSM 5974]PVZ26374.1 hypothetical protein LX19_00873 [Clostridium thermopalmarium DSM 5974]